MYKITKLRSSHQQWPLYLGAKHHSQVHRHTVTHLFSLCTVPRFLPQPSFVFMLCVQLIISPILMGSTITLMWMVPSPNFANPKSSCWPTHFWLLNQTIHSHVHWPHTQHGLSRGNPTPSAWITEDHQQLLPTPSDMVSLALPSAYSGQDIPPSHVCLLTPTHVPSAQTKSLSLPQAFQTHATRRNALSPLYWTALVLTSFRDLYSYPAS